MQTAIFEKNSKKIKKVLDFLMRIVYNTKARKKQTSMRASIIEN